MADTHFKKLSAIAAAPINIETADTFLAGYCIAPLEDIPEIRVQVTPWISLLPTLIHLAAGYEYKTFSPLALFCAQNYRLPSAYAERTVLNAMNAFTQVFELNEELVHNWDALSILIQNSSREGPLHAGDFSCE